jgi:hypothetical protein
MRLRIIVSLAQIAQDWKPAEMGSSDLFLDL